nr:hypothetical protein [Tanacetum cinerariifolium]
MENHEQSFVDYASSPDKEVEGKQFTTNQGPKKFNESTNAWKVVEVKEKVGGEFSCSETVIKETKSRDLEQNNLGDRVCKITKEIEEVGEWMEYEEPLDLVDTRDESVYEYLIEKMPSCSLSFDFRIEKRDLNSEMDDFTSEGHDLLSSTVILSEGDYRRGCERASELESGFYLDVDKLDPSYKEKTNRINLDGSFEVGRSRRSEVNDKVGAT